MTDPKLLAICIEIREAFSYFSEYELPIGFEDRLNEALKPYGEMVDGEWVAKPVDDFVKGFPADFDAQAEADKIYTERQAAKVELKRILKRGRS